MHSPSVGDLLAGVHRTLSAEVLPELTSGAAQRQLKAAVVILRRLERSWSRMPFYLVVEASDIVSTLHRVLDGLDGDAPTRATSALIARLSDEGAPEKPRDFEQLVARDERLQALLVDVDEHLRGREDGSATDGLAELAALYARMVARQDHAWGTSG